MVNILPSVSSYHTLIFSQVAFFGLCMALAGVIFFYVGVSMGWLYLFMGVILGSAVVPIALACTWRKANKMGCIVGSIAGFVAGLVAWLVTTSTLNGGVINVVVSCFFLSKIDVQRLSGVFLFRKDERG
jgi:Na+/proline symporter